jgi:hypothetical protein
MGQGPQLDHEIRRAAALTPGRWQPGLKSRSAAVSYCSLGVLSFRAQARKAKRYASIQNDSGLAQGFAGRPAAGWSSPIRGMLR